jgi:hypothetical protein
VRESALCCVPMNRVTLDGIELDDEIRNARVAVREWTFGRGDAARIIRLFLRGVFVARHPLEPR